MNICILIISEVKRKSSSNNEQTSIHPLIFIRVTGGGAYPSYTGGEACTPVQVHSLSQEKHENIKTVWC